MQGQGAGGICSTSGARVLISRAGEPQGGEGTEGAERTLGAWDSHDVRTSADRREGKGRRVRMALRVARAYGHDHGKVGQSRVPGLRRAPGRRAHATVLVPRVRGDHQKSLARGQNRTEAPSR